MPTGSKSMGAGNHGMGAGELRQTAIDGTG